MEAENTQSEYLQRDWCIDISWYEQYRCSLFVLAQSSLCGKCRKKLKGELAPAELMANIKKCCSRTTGYITSDQPLMESVFRIFLAGGNQTMSLSQLKDQLEARRGGTLSLSLPALGRLLDRDRYYGIHAVSRS